MVILSEDLGALLPEVDQGARIGSPICRERPANAARQSWTIGSTVGRWRAVPQASPRRLQ